MDSAIWTTGSSVEHTKMIHFGSKELSWRWQQLNPALIYLQMVFADILLCIFGREKTKQNIHGILFSVEKIKTKEVLPQYQSNLTFAGHLINWQDFVFSTEVVSVYKIHNK